MSSELVRPLETAEVPDRAQRSARARAVASLGPLTVVAGVGWGLAQPYRIAFLQPDGKGIYDWLVQAPLLVVLVGLVFALAVAPGVLEDMAREDGER